jgi:hypothetical protein
MSSDRLAGPVRDDVGVGCSLAERLVGPVGVVVLDVLAEEPFELAAVPDEGAIEKLAAHAGDPAFRVGVRDRGTRWRVDNRRAVAAKDLVERGDERTGSSGNSMSRSPSAIRVSFACVIPAIPSPRTRMKWMFVSTRVLASRPVNRFVMEFTSPCL